MTPRITVLTLGVDDLERSVAFYRDGLGFETKGIVGAEFENGAVAFFNLEGGLKLALWPRRSMAIDNCLPVDPPSSTEVLIGHNVASPDEVDAAMREVEKAGATIVRTAHKTFYGGYSGSFKDPDGHLWEIVHVPNFDQLG